ncbi:QacE family quaternary ammonium compound efflux SMR transporter [Helicobacter sp. 16-1353]|uniref:DMT family transporter n=1 Tax=Helicobacter sp. 16-1353 TaxID=2004996 RepID=UPI000DCF19DC|nr:SMR family transporter [Helicobacter sp. 16-1353]RAX54067.1 QacE family quaternary ammonium compound efflux SMR transporter [Helicobacter sp. 16-1353]
MNNVERKKILAWFFLLLAIITEVVSAGFLKVGDGRLFGYIFMVVFITLSYYLLALALTKIKVGIAYAIWEVLGSSLIVLMSLFIFDEIVTTKQAIGIILAITGIVLINIGEAKEK